MKKIISVAPLALLSLMAYNQSSYNDITTEQWAEDVTYLNKKIQKQFISFTPGIKDLFKEEVNTILSTLSEKRGYQAPCEIMRLLSKLNDGHTELNIGQKSVGFHRVPISLYVFKGDFRVIASHESYSDILGARVTSIGGHPINDVFDTLKSYMSHDNEQEFLHAGPGYIILTELLACMGITSDPLNVSFEFEKEDGTMVTRSLDGLNRSDYSEGPWATLWSQNEVSTPLYLSNNSDNYWFTELNQAKVIYFHFASVNDQKGKPSIKKFSKELFGRIDELKPEKFIIDLRMNTGGNYHLTDPIVEGILARPWLNQPGKVWVITSRRTFSAASTFCIFLKQRTTAQIIGEAGRSHPNKSSNNEYMTLPNSGYLIEYTTKIKNKWPERPDLDRIPTDVEILPDFESYKIGSDVVMEYLLKE